MKTAFAILVVVSTFAGVCSFFGLPVDYPLVREEFENAWYDPSTDDSFVSSMIGDVLQYDKLETIQIYLPIVQTVHSTLSNLHASLVEKFGNDNGDTDELFRQLKADIQNAVNFIGNLKTQIPYLSGSSTNQWFASQLDKRFTEILTHIPALLTLVTNFEEVTTQMRASSLSVTLENMANFFKYDQTLYDPRPVVVLSADLSNLYDNYFWLIWQRYSAISFQRDVDATIQDNLSLLVNGTILDGIIQAIEDVTVRLEQRAETHLVTLQNTLNYTSILDPAYYNYGEQTVTDYFANITSIVSRCYSLYLPELNRTLQNNITVLLQGHKQTLMDLTSNTVQFISDSGSISSSLYSDSCSQYFISQILDDSNFSNASGNLKVCFLMEPPLIAAIYQDAKASLDAAIEYATKPLELFSLCDSSSGACFKRFIKHLPNYVSRVKLHVAGALRMVAKKLKLSLSRMQLCSQVVQADVQEFYDQQKIESQACLQETIQSPFNRQTKNKDA